MFDTSADAFVNATVEQQLRSSFDFARRSIRADIGRKQPHDISVSGGYQIQRIEVFDENAARGRPAHRCLFPQVRLSSFSASVIRDTRDDPVDPTRGNYVSANGQFAGRAIGSEVGFAKMFTSAELFRTLPHARGIVFAGDARARAWRRDSRARPVTPRAAGHG